MELRHLEYFMMMCQELHFTNASHKLGISQPTLSQQIRMLEQEMNTSLFDRVGKKVFLTEAGKILYRHSMRIFDELQQAELAIRELEGLTKGSIHVGCSGNHLLISSIISFNEKYPGIQIHISELSTEETKRGLLDNVFDLGVVFLPIEDEQITSIPLYTESLILLAPEGHPLAELGQVELEQLRAMPLALLPPKFLVRQIIDRATRDKGFMFAPILEMTTLDSLMELVKQRVALTILPESYMSRMQPERISKLPIIRPTPQREVGIVYRSDKFVSSAALAFIEHIKQTFSNS